MIGLFSINLITAQAEKEMSKFKHSEERSERQLEKLKAELALTDTQVKQIAAINSDFLAKVKATKEAATDRDAARETLKALRGEKSTAFKDILNREQVVTYEAMKKERKGRRGSRSRPGKHAGTPEERAQKHTARLTEKLNLSDPQAAKVATINLSYAEKMKAAKDASTDKEENRAARKALRTEQHTAIEAVLTPEQVTTFDAMKEERKGRRGGHGKQADTPEESAQKHTAKLTEKLSLSDAQAAKVATINLAHAEKMKAAKDASTDKEENRAARKILRTEHHTAIKAVLTPEQVTIFETMKEERKGRRGGHGKHAGTPEERAQKHTARLAEKLSLTEVQTAKVAAINLAHAEKMKASKDAATDKEENREAWKALRAEHNTAIETVLTPEQVTTFEAMKKERKGKGRKGRK